MKHSDKNTFENLLVGIGTAKFYKSDWRINLNLSGEDITTSEASFTILDNR